MHRFDKITKAKLPPLTGRESRIAWAWQIRERALIDNPDLAELQTKTAADWWIENRHRLTPRAPRYARDDMRGSTTAEQRAARAAWRKSDLN